LAISQFFGEFPSDITLENLRGFLGALNDAKPAPDAQILPPGVKT